MKTSSLRFSITSVIGICLTQSAHAFYQVPFGPTPISVWTAIADTGGTAPLKHGGGGTVGTFSGFVPPVIQNVGTGSGIAQIAFKGRMVVGGPITALNDEGIWSNADPLLWWTAGIPSATAWMVAQEGDAVGARTLGNAGNLLVRALQSTPFGGTLFTTNSDATVALNLSVYEGSGLNGLAGLSLGLFTDGGRAVSDGNSRIAAWTSTGANATRYWDVTAPPSFPHGLTVGTFATSVPRSRAVRP